MSPNLPRCNGCKARIVFFGSPFTGRPRTFEARPVDGHTEAAAGAFPVMSGRAHKFHELAAVIQVQRECSSDEAEREVRDMPWYRPHDCPNSPFTTDTPSERTA